MLKALHNTHQPLPALLVWDNAAAFRLCRKKWTKLTNLNTYWWQAGVKRSAISSESHHVLYVCISKVEGLHCGTITSWFVGVFNAHCRTWEHFLMNWFNRGNTGWSVICACWETLSPSAEQPLHGWLFVGSTDAAEPGWSTVISQPHKCGNWEGDTMLADICQKQTTTRRLNSESRWAQKMRLGHKS